MDASGEAHELRARLDEHHQRQKDLQKQKGLFTEVAPHAEPDNEQIGAPQSDASESLLEKPESVPPVESLASGEPTGSQAELPMTGTAREVDVEAEAPVAPSPSSVPAAEEADEQVLIGERVKLGQAHYLQLHRDNVGQYFIRGAFYPNALELNQQYKENRAEDILSQFPGYLVLAPGIVGDFEENQLLIELQLREEDAINSEVVDELCFLNTPLPISRIKSISFATESAQSSFYNNVESFRDYFFPKSLSRAIRDDIPTVEGELSRQPRLPATNVAKWTEVLERFDRVLGMFGYMKIASVLRANVEGPLVDYPDEFLGAWHEINTAIEKPERAKTPVFKSLLRLDIDQGQGVVRAKRALFFALINTIYSGEQISYATAIKLINQVGGAFKRSNLVGKEAESQESQLQELRVAAEEFNKLSTPGLIPFQSVLKHFEGPQNEHASSNLPLSALVLLGKFSDRKRDKSDKQAALNYFARTNAAIQKTDLIQYLAIMGLYYGYQSLVREMENPFTEQPELASLNEDTNRLRFRMEKPDDRRLVESVFRFSKSDGSPIHDGLNYLDFDISNYKGLVIHAAGSQTIQQPQVPLFEPAPIEVKAVEPLTTAASAVVDKLSWQAAYPEGVGPDSVLYIALMKLRPESFIKSVAEIEALLEELPASQRTALQELAFLMGK
ncbi:hypothetical protein GCM10023186_46060 [Hymenobacter koreensis]|uniref:2-Component system ADP-ribosyltransferase domain-containing protein n=1 Tax=Hymenobacter koreensis TaxID=1084523 RepID=A0ABP8JQ60_9BACT